MSDKFKRLLTSGFTKDQNIPDATKRCSSPTYIRALITRARIVNGGLKREQIASKCGTSLSSLNKYTKSYDNVSCPYVMQYALEKLAGISDHEGGAIFRLEMYVNEKDAVFFSAFDEFKKIQWGTLSTISFLIALSPEEEKYIKTQYEKVTLEKQEIGST